MLKLLFAALAAAMMASSPAVAGEAAKLKGKNAYFSDGGIAEYHNDGSYRYGRWIGTYKITGNRVCVKFKRGGSRCDTILPGNRLRNAQGMIFTFTLR
ncbi:MAG: hypothetical protein UY74_C0073G0004 [Candidatus Kaiserbacteria bacterium GW2011_GWC2_52_8b]|uniref:Uncharacterized protein n=1 Tax=Candidatus Kaiserbacteria bacterium GW2011_GWC2_52_8b TaxID=1618676 RepID=A0A0G2AAS2_9BACT|nr:MAG: hypothetical protein UY74_C0073G0004 [Candidatus Kaiserbacteria bacterium GW2011_GWC2_52_8b]